MIVIYDNYRAGACALVHFFVHPSDFLAGLTFKKSFYNSKFDVVPIKVLWKDEIDVLKQHKNKWVNVETLTLRHMRRCDALHVGPVNVAEKRMPQQASVASPAGGWQEQA